MIGTPRWQVLDKRRFGEWTTAALFLCVVLLTVFAPIIFGGKTLLPSDMLDTMTLPYSQQYSPAHASNYYTADGVLQFYPYKAYTQSMLSQGHVSYWDPYIFCGYPRYAETMATSFSVYNLLLVLPLPFAFNLLLIVPLLVAGFGMYLLLRYYNISHWVALLFGSAYMLNSMFLTHAHTMAIPASFSWVPYIFLFFERHRQSKNRFDLLLCTLFLTFAVLCGNFQSSVFILLTLLLFVLFRGDRWGRSLKVLTLSTLFALGLSAIMLIPSLELFYHVIQDGALNSTSISAHYGMLQRLLSIPLLSSLFVPELAGGIRSMSLTSLVNSYATDFAGSLGFLPMLFGSWAAFTMWNKHPELRGYIVLAFAGIALPIFTPLYSLLYHRFFIVSTFSLCVIGARQFDEFIFRRIPWDSFRIPWRLAKLSFYSICSFLLIFSITYFIFQGRIDTYLLHRFASPESRSAFAEGNQSWNIQRVLNTVHHFTLLSPIVLLPLLSILLALLALRLFRNYRISSNTMLAIAFAITLFQLGYFARLWLPMTDTTKYPLYPATPTTTFLQNDTSQFRFFAVRRVVPNEQYVFLPNQNEMYRLSEVGGYESLMSRSFYPATIPYLDREHIRPKFLGLLNVKYILSGPTPLADTSIHLIDDHGIRIYANPYVQPRAWIAHAAKQVTNDSIAIQTLLQDSFSRDSILVSDAITDLSTPSTSTDSLRTLSYSPNRITYDASLGAPAYFVSSDTYYQGWQCTVNGQPSEIFRCNYAMRGVTLPKGHSTIVFEFKPQSFQIGLWVSALSLILLVAFCVFL